ncbi:class I SAM-dependent methyltransferase [Streptomyces albidoflavus]
MPGTAGYAEGASELVAQYEAVAFADVYREVLHLFPPGPSLIADIGAGSGRDAAALAARGHRVVAVEPTAELRSLGSRIHGDQSIEWIDDALPDLQVLRERRQRFDAILLSAVWMHLDVQERRLAMNYLASLLSARGRLFLSLRHGPVPAGRRMFAVSAQETCALGAASGLDVLHRSQAEDLHQRAGVYWSRLALQRTSGP